MRIEIVNKFGKETLYQAKIGDLTVPFSITRVKDKKGTLLRMESSKTGLFESYSMKDVKEKLINSNKTNN